MISAARWFRRSGIAAWCVLGLWSCSWLYGAWGLNSDAPLLAVFSAGILYAACVYRADLWLCSTVDHASAVRRGGGAALALIAAGYLQGYVHFRGLACDWLDRERPNYVSVDWKSATCNSAVSALFRAATGDDAPNGFVTFLRLRAAGGIESSTFAGGPGARLLPSNRVAAEDLWEWIAWLCQILLGGVPAIMATNLAAIARRERPTVRPRPVPWLPSAPAPDADGGHPEFDIGGLTLPMGRRQFARDEDFQEALDRYVDARYRQLEGRAARPRREDFLSEPDYRQALLARLRARYAREFPDPTERARLLAIALSGVPPGSLDDTTGAVDPGLSARAARALAKQAGELLALATSGVQDNRPSYVQLALDKGLSPNAIVARESLLELAIRLKRKAIVRLLIARGAAPDVAGTGGRSPLESAVAQGNTALVGALLTHGADVNAIHDPRTLLTIAADRGDVPMIKQLCRRGAHVNHADSRGYTALCAAFACTRTYHGAAIRALLARGAELGQPQWRQSRPCLQTLLDAVLAGGHAESVALLVDAGFRLETRLPENAHRTFLHLAVASGRVPIAAELLRCGADLGARDDNGATPWEIAETIVPAVLARSPATVAALRQILETYRDGKIKPRHGRRGRGREKHGAADPAP